MSSSTPMEVAPQKQEQEEVFEKMILLGIVDSQQNIPNGKIPSIPWIKAALTNAYSKALESLDNKELETAENVKLFIAELEKKLTKTQPAPTAPPQEQQQATQSEFIGAPFTYTMISPSPPRPVFIDDSLLSVAPKKQPVFVFSQTPIVSATPQITTTTAASMAAASTNSPKLQTMHMNKGSAFMNVDDETDGTW